MSTAILYGRQSAQKIGSLAADITCREDHALSASITSHPVEQGVEISDHIRPEPVSLTLEQIVSQTPLADRLAVKRDNIGATWDRLRQLSGKAEPVTVVSSLEVYDNMGVERVAVTRDPENSGYLRYTAQLKQIRIARSQSVAIPPGALGAREAKGDKPGTVADQASPEVDKGQTQTKDATPAREEKARNASSAHEVFG